MPEPPAAAPPPPEKWELPLIVGLTVFAAVRLFLLIVALPLFMIVDEFHHFDLLSTYAQGRLPGPGTDTYGTASSHLIALFMSPEYVEPDTPALRGRPPLWKERPALREKIENQRVSHLVQTINHEAFSPPPITRLRAFGMTLAVYSGSRADPQSTGIASSTFFSIRR